MAENGCPNFRGLFTTKVIKSYVKLHVKSDAQKVNYVRLPVLPPSKDGWNLNAQLFIGFSSFFGLVLNWPFSGIVYLLS